MAFVYLDGDRPFFTCLCHNHIARRTDLVCNYRPENPVSRGWFRNIYNVNYIRSEVNDGYMHQVICRDCERRLGLQLTIKENATFKLKLEEMGSFVVNMHNLTLVLPSGETKTGNRVRTVNVHENWELDPFKVDLNELIMVYSRFWGFMSERLALYLD